MLTVFAILAIAALLTAIAAASPPRSAYLWVAVVLLAIIECLRCLPLGR